MAGRARGDTLALADAGRLDVVAKDLPQRRVVEALALDADEERLLDERLAHRVVVDDQRHERGVDRDRPLPPALRLAHLEQAPREVDVVPVEPEELAAPQTCVGHQREQEAVALRLGMEVPLPDLLLSCGREQALEFSHRQHVGEHFALLRRPQRQRRIAQQTLFLDQEAKEALQRRGRPRLTRDGRPTLVFAREEGAQVRHVHLGELDPLTLQVTQTRQNVTLVRRASHRRKPPLEPAKTQEIRHFPARLRLHRSSFGQPSGPRWSEPWTYPAYRPATEKAPATGLFLWFMLLLKVPVDQGAEMRAAVMSIAKGFSTYSEGMTLCCKER